MGESEKQTVTMREVKSIDEIYAEVRDYDMVITNDRPLATALNSRVEKPMVGMFAVTPIDIAYSVSTRILGKTVPNEVQTVMDIAEGTGLDFRYVHGELRKIHEICKYKQMGPETSDNARDYMMSSTSKEVYDSYMDIPNIESVMNSFDAEKDEYFAFAQKIAVIDTGKDMPTLYNFLDKQMKYKAADVINVFKDGEYEIQTVYQLGNDRMLAENAVDLINRDSSTEYAIVINTESPIADAVRSALYRKSIPFVNQLEVRDLASVRDYIRFIRLSLNFETLRVSEIKDMFSHYGAYFKGSKDEYLLSKMTAEFTNPKAQELIGVMKDIRSYTFDNVRELISSGRGRSQVKGLLIDLKLIEDKITEDKTLLIAYAVDNIENLQVNEKIPETEKHGVLIADCNSSMFIDRPIVIYLGMGQDWNVKVVGKPYIDPLEEKDRAVVKLQIVLQQGVERFYFANISKEGKDARPCMTFDYICNEPREKFTQICREVIREPWVDGFDSNTIEKVDVETDAEDGFHGNFSKTGFNNYIRCPRMFMFGKSGLVDPTNDKMEFGTLLHEFAEFYTCYPGMVDPDDLEAYVGGFIDEYSGLSNEVMQPIDRDQIELGMRNIIRFVDSLELGEVPLDRELDQRHTNRFMERAGVFKCSSLCETEHINDGLGLYGKFDLYVNHTIYDYKTGKISEASSLAENMDVNEVKKYAEFQPILYLAIANVEDPQTRSFVQFYPMAYDWEVSQTGDISGNFRRFVLSDESLGDLMRDDPFIISKITGARSDQLEQCFKDNPEILVDTVADYYSNPIKDWSNDDELVQAIRAAFLGIKSDLSDEQISFAIKKVASLTPSGMKYDDELGIVEIPADTFEYCKKLAKEMNIKANEQARTDYPAEPKVDCESCPYFKYCTADIMIREEVISDD